MTNRARNLAVIRVEAHNCHMTIDTLEKEMLGLPPRSRVRLAEKLIESIEDFDSPEIASEWASEIERRVNDIESGREEGIPADRIMREARRKINESRHVSSARRK